MQPTPPRRTQESDAAAVFQSNRPPGLSRAATRATTGEAPGRLAADQGPDEADGVGGTLDDVARRERDDMRPRLRNELGREPTEEELDEWLRRHTEGH